MRKVIVSCIAFIFLISLLGCMPVQFFPKDGIWYCSELKMQLDFQDESNCFYIYEGDKIKCGLGYDKGSSWLSVGCQDDNTTHFFLGEEIWGGEFVSLDANKLTLIEVKTGTEYCFLRTQQEGG